MTPSSPKKIAGFSIASVSSFSLKLPRFLPFFKSVLAPHKTDLSHQPETHIVSAFPTILYMPHCDREVYESVLRFNWTPRGLSEVILLANRLMDYVENQPERKLQAESPHLLSLAPCLECSLLPEFKAHPTAFNNLAVQRIPLPAAQDVCDRMCPRGEHWQG